MAKRVLILATDGFEQSELLEPRKALEAAGFKTTLASPTPGTIRGWHDGDWGKPIKVDKDIEDVSADDFDALLLPGGQMNPDILRMDDRVIELIEDLRFGEQANRRDLPRTMAANRSGTLSMAAP